MRFRNLVFFSISMTAARAAEVASSGSTTTNKPSQASEWKRNGIEFIWVHGPALLGAVVMLTAGWIVAGWIRKIVERALERKQFEPPVRMLLGRVVHLLVVGLTAVIALDTVGFKMTTVIAGLSVAGVGVGLAMQGVLGNLVAGLVIIFTKPFRVGEYVAMVGVEGQVRQIELFSTTLTHADRSRVVIPNRKIVGEVLHNYGMIRQLDLVVGVAYRTDLNAALGTVNSVLLQNARVLKDPAPVVGVTMLADSSINIAVKPWTAIGDFLPAKAELYQAIVERFREDNVRIPFPQREVRMLTD